MSYCEALEAAGCEVIEFKEYGSYQGEWLALVSVDGEIGVVDGCYGSCSGCDAFYAEFGWSDECGDDYRERLSDFGKGYLPALPIGHYISRLEEQKNKDHEWWDDDSQEMLDDLKKWKEK